MNSSSSRVVSLSKADSGRLRARARRAGAQQWCGAVCAWRGGCGQLANDSEERAESHAQRWPPLRPVAPPATPRASRTRHCRSYRRFSQ
eukprot:2818456-Prymnesium_polylepis.1